MPAPKATMFATMRMARLRHYAENNIPCGNIWKPRVVAEKGGCNLWRWRDTNSSDQSGYGYTSERKALIAGILKCWPED